MMCGAQLWVVMMMLRTFAPHLSFCTQLWSKGLGSKLPSRCLLSSYTCYTLLLSPFSLLPLLPSVCKAGYGGKACDMCGGTQPNYGPGVRPIGTDCVACPELGGPDGGGGIGGFSFIDPKGGQNFFTPRVIAAIAATRPTECIAEFTQVSDNAWNLEPSVRFEWCFVLTRVYMHRDRTSRAPNHRYGATERA